jgi:uncharacterized protein (UPF0548 family)
MKLMPSWLTHRAPFECQRWAGCSPTAATADHIGIHDVYTVPLLGSGNPASIVESARAVLFCYDVFPAHRMRHHVCTDDGILRAGALVVQRLIAGPLAMEAAVRVAEVFDERAGHGHAGFTYTTLEGHIERGAATFSVGLDASGAPIFRIESWSRPGSAVAMLGRPWLRWMQRRSVHEALRHVQARVRESPRRH